jgi:hypothetical protein
VLHPILIALVVYPHTISSTHTMIP